MDVMMVVVMVDPLVVNLVAVMVDWMDMM